MCVLQIVPKITGRDKGREEIPVSFSLQLCLFHQFSSSLFCVVCLLFSFVIFSKVSVFDQSGQSGIKKNQEYNHTAVIKHPNVHETTSHLVWWKLSSITSVIV